MAKKIIIAIAVLAVIGALVFWYQDSQNDDGADSRVQLSLTVFNQTKNSDGATVSANPRDVLVYTLTARNTSDDTVSGYVVETNIDDISQLATLTDAAGANYNASTNSLMWTPLDIPANDQIEKTFTVRIKESLPSDSDMIMSASFGNEILVAVSTEAAPVPTPTLTPVANNDQPSYQAPTTGPSVWFAFVLAILFTAGILMYRLGKRINV
jgi:hypothetical protein